MIDLCAARSVRIATLTILIFLTTGYLLSASTLAFGWRNTFAPARIESWPYVEVVVHDGKEWPYRTFKSSAWMPPNMTITRNEGALAKGYYIFTAKNRRHSGVLVQSAPVIMTDDNELVYAHDGPYGANNFRVQEVNGKPHLTVWLGESVTGHGYGQFYTIDETYEVQTSLFSGNVALQSLGAGKKAPGLSDFHEQEMTERGTVYMVAYNNTQVNLTSIGGKEDGWLSDSLIYEVNMTTGETLFTWSAKDHIPLEASKLPIKSYMGDGSKGHPWDHFHINSVQEIGENLLINSRHTFAMYLLSRKTGEVLWELSGRGEGGDFGPLAEADRFKWHHQARAHNVTEDGMTISIFDNHNMQEDNDTAPTRGLVLRVDLPPDASKPPTVLSSVRGDEPFYVGSQGSYDPALENGNQLMCYGPVPVIQEFGPNGEVRWEGRFGRDDTVQSYRAFKSEWHATPADWDPRLHVEKIHDSARQDEQQVEGYVSWNGATDVTGWNVHVRRGGAWSNMGRADRKGFETVFRVAAPEGCVVVGAVMDGVEVRRSNEVCL
ncbi:uncharacterized protein J7T54_003097 [Emericellopsis cladophorae]|uniref:ASST-domain-containing protein n=1 Tax=Emericellopsis cladophorae TaxID=2686198 RepID=A0A9P9Y086_9HYPO|nr:uncharacterized protein J7T54_003097 [Emericellopsis cladophorae]KAI6780955.1 hypothetical protein J7T54_003097 [Emericellopsis cladophorae]